MESVLAIEQQEYEREIEDKKRRHETQRDDEYTEEQIRSLLVLKTGNY